METVGDIHKSPTTDAIIRAPSRSHLGRLSNHLLQSTRPLRSLLQNLHCTPSVSPISTPLASARAQEASPPNLSSPFLVVNIMLPLLRSVCFQPCFNSGSLQAPCSRVSTSSASSATSRRLDHRISLDRLARSGLRKMSRYVNENRQVCIRPRKKASGIREVRLIVVLLAMEKDYNHEIIGLEVTLLSWSDNSFTADRCRSARIPFTSTMAIAQDISPNQTSQQHYNAISAHQHFLLKHILQRPHSTSRKAHHITFLKS